MIGMALFQGLFDREARVLERVNHLVQAGVSALDAGSEARAAVAFVKALSLLEVREPTARFEDYAKAFADVGEGLLRVGRLESGQAAANHAMALDRGTLGPEGRCPSPKERARRGPVLVRSRPPHRFGSKGRAGGQGPHVRRRWRTAARPPLPRPRDPGRPVRSERMAPARRRPRRIEPERRSIEVLRRGVATAGRGCERLVRSRGTPPQDRAECGRRLRVRPRGGALTKVPETPHGPTRGVAWPRPMG